MIKLELLTLIESILNKGKVQNKGNVAFHCPFCSHHKKKLEVNLTSQHWHCWICNAKGRKLITLFKKLNVERYKINKLFELINETDYQVNKKTVDTRILHYPIDAKPLWKINNTPDYRNAIYYLKNRNIGIYDILKYQISYCETGEYSGKIIIPSFDSNGELNYFVARAFYEDDVIKHKNPYVSKDIIGFELFINWNLPIVLVEGAFDAITVKRNCIPLFGKTISNKLKQKIIEKNVKEIYICLDEDAKKQALETAQYFMSNGINVYFVDLKEKDPNEIGFPKIIEQIELTEQLSPSSLMEYQILGI
jgi:DNA primase